MSISQLFIIAAFAFLIGQLPTGRSWMLLGASTFMVYWLQPVQQQINLTFWLPTITLAITGLVWLLTSTPEVRAWSQNLPAAAMLLGVILFVDWNAIPREYFWDVSLHLGAEGERLLVETVNPEVLSIACTQNP